MSTQDEERVLTIGVDDDDDDELLKKAVAMSLGADLPQASQPNHLLPMATNNVEASPNSTFDRWKEMSVEDREALVRGLDALQDTLGHRGDRPSAGAGSEDESDDFQKQLEKALKLSLDPNEQHIVQNQECVQAIKSSLADSRPTGAIRKYSSRPKDVDVNELSYEEQVKLAIEASKRESGRMVSNTDDLDENFEQAIKASLEEHERRKNVKGTPRPIVIDGNNVAFAHGNHQKFSHEGLAMCYEYFSNLGHTDVTIFVRRTKMDKRSWEWCENMRKTEILHWTPVRRVGNEVFKSSDDLIILQYANDVKGIVVSNDNYRDHLSNHPELMDQIKNRCTQFMFVKNRLIIPNDPLGEGGPKRDEFLRF